MGHPNESESLFTVTIDQQGVLDLAISEEFLRNLGFTDPSIIAEIIRNLDDLVDEAKIKFCGDANVNSKCVSDVLEFLQLMSLNLEHIAKAGVMHPAMWKSDDPVRHLMPEKGRWSPLVGGAIDGGVESAMGIPILVSTLGQLIIFEDQRNAALQIFTAAGFDRLKEAVASEIVEVFTDGEKREYTITKASVELALSYYVLLGKAAKGLNEVLEKVETLGNKLEKCPILRKYVQKSVDGKDVARLKKFDDLAAELDAEKLETIFSKVDAEKLDDLLDDLSESVNFKTALANEPELVEAWEVIEGNPILRKKPENLENISKWLDEGIEPQKLTDGIAKSPNKQNLIDELGTAQSKLHAQVLIKDYDNIPGVVKGRFVSNSSSMADKADLPSGWASNLDLDADAMSTFTGKVEPLELKPGDKIYRVSDGYRGSGAYWTRTKPNGLEDVVGGTAVRPEWNNFEYLYEYTLPDGVTIKSWKGNAARQRVSDVGSNYHLPGGDEQLLIPFIKDQDAGFVDKVIKTKAQW